MEPIRLGIIGCGVMGNSHLEFASSSEMYEALAVADLQQTRAEELAQKHGVPRVYGDGVALLEDNDVEAVILALPTFARPYLTLRAFANGKHVLAEKPIAMNAGQVRQFIAARGGLVAGCCSARNRLLGSAAAATELVASGALGELRVVRCRATTAADKAPDREPPLWRQSMSLNGGGILMNWGCYDLDYLLGLTGWSLKPKVVLSQTWPVATHLAARVARASDAESHFAALILCEDGAVITFERGEFVAIDTSNVWEITGTKGSLRLAMTPADEKTIYHDDTTSEDGVNTRVLWNGGETYPDVRAALLEDFAKAIREKRQPRTSLENALVVQEISDAIYASAEHRRAIELS